MSTELTSIEAIPHRGRSNVIHLILGVLSWTSVKTFQTCIFYAQVPSSLGPDVFRPVSLSLFCLPFFIPPALTL